MTGLVYFEEPSLYRAAVQRQSNLERCKSAWKLWLIVKIDPDWDDLYER